MKKLNNQTKALMLAIDIFKNMLDDMSYDDIDSYTTDEHCYGTDEMWDAVHQFEKLLKDLRK